MSTPACRFSAVRLCWMLVVLSGCGGSQLPNAPATASYAQASEHARHRDSSIYHVLFRFNDKLVGGFPTAALLDVNGVLYGTTTSGGASGGWGTVFSVSTKGKEKVLYSFAGGSDGADPSAGLVDVNGTLYGTTTSGGGSGCISEGCGTVFSITASGAEQVLYRFAGGSDGANPSADLIDVNGTLYGTTAGGGAHGYGTVFSVTTSGAEKVLHSFGRPSDGGIPAGGLIDVGGKLYGMTVAGGANGYGTVYRVTRGGSEKVLHSFDGKDGAYPNATLTDLNGVLYGTAAYGGHSDDGTIFSITDAGTETTLYSFRGGYDGMRPQAGLHALNGTLYGTTSLGGGSGCQNGLGCGTVFSITASGAESVLHSFNGYYDGRWPYGAGLIDLNGTLYGTTPDGGSHGGYACHDYHQSGCGTVFEFTP